METGETTLCAQLTGAVIGLARATEGNEDKITPQTRQAMIDGLAATAPGVPGDLEALLARVAEEKRKLIPNCCTCAAPCGRNNDYCLEDLQWEPQEIRELKALLLSAARTIAGAADPNAFPFLCRALIMLGISGYRREHLLPILQEAGGFLADTLI